MPYSNKSNPTVQQAGAAPALINYDNFLIAAYQKNDNSGEILCINSHDGSNWGSPVSIGLTSKGIPALGILNSELYCITPDAGDQSTLFSVKYTHGWGGLNKTTLQVASGSSVALASLTVSGVETLFCAFKGTDSQLTISSTTDGEHWSTVKTDVDTFTTPALSVLNGQLICTFIQDVKSNIVWTAVSADGQSWEVHKSMFASSTHVATTTVMWNEIETLVCGYILQGFENQLSVMGTHDGANWYNLFAEPVTGVSCNNATPGVAAFQGELFFLLQGDKGNSLDTFSVKQPGNILKPKQSLDGFDLQFMRRDFVDFQIDENADLYGIYKGSTASGQVEIVKSTAISNYGGAVSHLQTGLSLVQGNWTCLLDSQQNLIGVLRSGSASGKMEVFELSAASGYQKTSKHAVTTMDFPAEGDQFILASNNDLIKIDSNHKVSQLKADSGYTKINTYTLAGDTDFGKGPLKYQIDVFGNIYGFQLNGPKQYQVKMYGFSAGSQFQQMNINNVQFPILTALPALGLNHQLLFDKSMNLHVVDTDPVGMAFMTHKLVTGAYQKQSKTQETAFAKVVQPQFSLEAGEIAFSHGLNSSGGTWKVSNVSAPFETIKASSMGSGIPIKEISSVQVGPNTGVSMTPSGGTQAKDYFVDSDYLNGIGEFKLIHTETAANAGLSYSVLLTEDYRYVNNQLEKFTSYQTILKFVDPPAHVQVFCDQQTKIDCGKGVYVADNVNGVSIPVPSGSDSLVLSVEAVAIGTAPLRIQTPTMKPDEFVVIFADQQVHHKIANLPKNAVFENQKQLNLKTSLTQEGGSQVQKAIQNMARAVKYPANNSPYSNVGSMDDAHWQVSFQGSVPAYNKLTPEQSMAILHGSQAVQAGGAHGFFDDLFSDMSKVVSITVHSVSHAFTEAADDVESGVKTLAGDIEKAGQELARDIQITIQLVDKAFTFAMNHTAIGKAIGTVFHKIGAAINDVITFFSALFDWQEIERLAQVMVQMVGNGLQSTEVELNKVQIEIDQYFNQAEKEVNSFIQELRNELGLPNEAASSSIGTEIIHGIMWVISKMQEVVSDLTPIIPDFDQHPTMANLAEKLATLEEELLEQGLEDVNGVISTLVNTLANTISDPKNAEKIILGGILSIVQEIADDSIKIAETIFNFVMEMVRDLIQVIQQEMQKPFQIPFFGDLFKLVGAQEPKIIDMVGYVLAIPLTIYEKESNEKLFQHDVALSVEMQLQGNKHLRTLNVISSVVSGIVNSLRGLPVSFSALNVFAVLLNVINQFARNPYLIKLTFKDGQTDLTQLPSYVSNSPAKMAVEDAQSGVKHSWAYQFLPILFNVLLCFRKSDDGGAKKEGKQFPTTAILNALLQVPRIIFLIVGFTKHSGEKATGANASNGDGDVTNGSYYSTEQIIADFLVTLPPFAKVITSIDKDSRASILGSFVLQNGIMDVYAKLIDGTPKSTTITDPGNSSS